MGKTSDDCAARPRARHKGRSALLLSFEPVDLTALSAELADGFRRACARVKLTLTIECEAMPKPVLVNRPMWRATVLSLLLRALESTSRGGITLQVSAEGRHAVLRVSDTGRGIPGDDLPLLFSRRGPGERPQASNGESERIDLALVHDFVELHDGTIDVQSTPGTGSVFTVRLPFGRGHLSPDGIGGRLDDVLYALEEEVAG